MTRQLPTHDTLGARISRGLRPHSGWCYRCGYTWAASKEHITSYTETSGCFPLCEECWVLLGSPEARIEYYKILIDDWEANGSEVSDDTKRDIQKAVANGG